MKKKILNILFIVVILFGITGCGVNTKSEKGRETIAKDAEILDWKTVHDEISSNGAKASDYNGNWYIFSGIVSNIEENKCDMFLERSTDGYPVNAINVHLSTEELKELKDGQTLTVVGKFNSSNTFTDLTDAFIFPKSLYNDSQFVIELLSSQDRTYTPHYFKDYNFDSNGNVTNYTEISYGYTIKGNSRINQQDTSKHTLTYNENNQVISHTIQKYANKGSGDKTAGKSEATYTYNEDGFVATETTPSIYVGEDYTIYKYTYEKDKNGKIIKGTKNGSRWGDTTYEYNNNGDIIKEIGPTTTIIYTYEGKRLINEKSTYNSSGDEYEDIIYYYGVIAKK